MTPDIVIESTDWVNLNTEASITAGTEMTIINKGSSTVTVTESATKPTTASIGLPLKPIKSTGATYSVITISSDVTVPVWVKGSAAVSTLSVQTPTPA